VSRPSSVETLRRASRLHQELFLKNVHRSGKWCLLELQLQVCWSSDQSRCEHSGDDELDVVAQVVQDDVVAACSYSQRSKRSGCMQSMTINNVSHRSRSPNLQGTPTALMAQLHSLKTESGFEFRANRNPNLRLSFEYRNVGHIQWYTLCQSST